MPATLRMGMKNADVQTLQRLLNEKASPQPRLRDDGDFGNNTFAAVQKFQRMKGLNPDGVVGPQTWAALQGSAPGTNAGSPPPPTAEVGAQHGLPNLSGKSEADKYDFYVKCIEAGIGGKAAALADLSKGQRVILGIRVITNTRANQGGGVYDDRIVVLWNNGTKNVREFVANTEPSSRYEDGYKYAKKSFGNNAGGDRRKDLGRVPEGVHPYAKGSSTTYGNILRPTKDIIAERDTNHDGLFDQNDTVSNVSALNAGTSMLFHKGGNTITGSAGCQTMKPADFEKFWLALGTKQQRFLYVLVHAWRLQTLNK
jgi:peptidoglycan hydrolase-like protein with peptidoglycan-binding domain